MNAFDPAPAGAEPSSTAPLLLGDILWDFMAGSLDVLHCRAWEDPEATAEAVRTIADRWGQEDGEQDDPAIRGTRGRWQIENRRQEKEGVGTVYTPTSQK